MAKLVGLVGSIVNKAGNFVFSTWKGIQVAKAYQPNVVNPRSEGQVAQRTKFDYAVQYGIAMNRVPYLKQLWSLITPSTRVPYNEFLSRNLRNATFEADNTLCTNKIIISDNNDNLKSIVNGATSCALSSWDFDDIALGGCGDDPDGVLLIDVYNSNLLADPSQSPFRDSRMCVTIYDIDTYGSVPGTWPMEIPVHAPQYEDVFDVCYAAGDISGCLAYALWLIPFYTDGSGSAPSSPSDITRVGNAVLLFSTGV